MFVQKNPPPGLSGRGDSISYFAAVFIKLTGPFPGSYVLTGTTKFFIAFPLDFSPSFNSLTCCTYAIYVINFPRFGMEW
jgi:hypothetical protein